MNNINGKNKRNIFLYWTGKEYKLISILRNLIYLHSTNGLGYNVIHPFNFHFGHFENKPF